MQNRMNLKLFEPGMTHLHRVGLAGLYMTLKQLDPEEFKDTGGWRLHKTGIELFWKEKPRKLIAPIIEKSFGISRDGLIDFLVHRRKGLGDLERVQIHNAILRTFLQHGKTRKIASTTSKVSYEYDGKKINVDIAPIYSYQNQSIEEIFRKNGAQLTKTIKLAGWNFPGGGVRHIGFSGSSLTENPENFLCLVFAPVGSLYFLISTKNSEGKYDARKGAAIVLPHLKNLEAYDECYQNYLTSPVDRLYASSLGDAGLNALTALNLYTRSLRDLWIDSCTTIILGTISWSKQQKTRTGISHFKNIEKHNLNFFFSASNLLKNRFIIKDDDTYYVQTSTVRGLISDNIASGKPWYNNFINAMQSKKIAKITMYERKELNAMAYDETTKWPHEEDKLFVQAVHRALRNRYGALAARAKEKGEKIPFDREFEKIRTSLMRIKNAQTMRAEIADLFARGGINKELQQHWDKLLSLFTSSDWQRTRDLALLALASYAGKGADEVDNAGNEEQLLSQQ